jgi:hypothetical protein
MKHIQKQIEQGVCHTVAIAIYIIKMYLKAREELWKLKLFHHSKNLPNLQNNPLKEIKILQDIITL